MIRRIQGRCAFVVVAAAMVLGTATSSFAQALCSTAVSVRAKTGSIELLWSAIAGAVSISVQRGPSAGGPFGTIATLPGTATVLTDAPVANNVLFYYRLLVTTATGPCSSGVIAAMAPAARVAVVATPNVVRDTDAVARGKIAAARLVVGAVTLAASAVVPAGQVISQDPPAGSSVPLNSAVALVVSLGPANVNVPNVVNLTQAAATSAITTAGLVLGTVTQANHATVPAGSVISQNPTAGTSVAPGSAVALVVSLGPANVNVPNVLNLTQAAAETAIVNAGLVVGNVTQANDPTVPIGQVASQAPLGGTSVAPGSAVDLVISLGPGAGVPTTLTLAISQALVGGGGTINITAEVFTAGAVEIVPTPPVAYSIIAGVGATGTVPGINGAQVTTSPNTRGNYTLRGTVTGTAVTTDVGFTVVDGAATSSNVGKLVKLSASENGAANALDDLLEALQDGNLGAVAGMNGALQAAKNLSPITGPNTVRRSAAVAPETGFLPTPARLQGNGFPTTAADTAFGALIPQIVAKVGQLTSFYNTLNPASGNDSVTELNTLNTELLALRNQLFSLAITPRGIVNNSRQINNMMANNFPDHLHAVAGRVNTVLADQGLLATNIRPEEFFGQKPGGELAMTAPGAFYAKANPAFFGLLGLIGGSSLQMKLVNEIYGEIMQEVTRMMVILIADGLIDAYTNFARLEGITTGGSLSFHAFGLPGSTVQGSGMDTTFLGRNEVFLVGPAQVSAVQNAATACNPTNWEDLQDAYDCFDAIVNGLGDSYDLAHQPPSSIQFGCLLDIFDEHSGCTTLEYDSGFDDVNDTRFPSPVIVLYHNLDTGSRSFGTFNFAP